MHPPSAPLLRVLLPYTNAGGEGGGTHCVPRRLRPPECVSLNRTCSLALTFQVGCKLSLVLFQYCIMANFYWLLVEGLHLHTLLAASFSPGRHFQAYLLIGWGKAALPTSCPAPPQLPTSPPGPCSCPLRRHCAAPGGAPQAT